MICTKKATSVKHNESEEAITEGVGLTLSLWAATSLLQIALTPSVSPEGAELKA